MTRHTARCPSTLPRTHPTRKSLRLRMWKCPNPRRYLQYPPKIFLHYVATWHADFPAFSYSFPRPRWNWVPPSWSEKTRCKNKKPKWGWMRTKRRRKALRCCDPTKNIKWYAPRFVFHFSPFCLRGDAWPTTPSISESMGQRAKENVYEGFYLAISRTFIYWY